MVSTAILIMAELSHWASDAMREVRRLNFWFRNVSELFSGRQSLILSRDHGKVRTS